MFLSLPFSVRRAYVYSHGALHAGPGIGQYPLTLPDVDDSAKTTGSADDRDDCDDCDDCHRGQKLERMPVGVRRREPVRGPSGGLDGGGFGVGDDERKRG